MDRYIENDSAAYSILPSWILPKVIADERENDAKFVAKHQAILQSLVGDDAFIARVIVDEPLTDAEQQQWISRIRWPLRVKCGKILISGGYDPYTIAELAEDDSSFFEIPPGDYAADIYTYLNTMNGRVFREQWGDDALLGTWFRHDHPSVAFPTWVASELYWSPEEDPGFESEWNGISEAVQAGKLRIARGPLAWVGVVVHLTADPQPSDLSEPNAEGFFSPETGLRRPSHFPLGIPANVEDVTVSSEVIEAIEASR